MAAERDNCSIFIRGGWRFVVYRPPKVCLQWGVAHAPVDQDACAHKLASGIVPAFVSTRSKEHRKIKVQEHLLFHHKNTALRQRNIASLIERRLLVVHEGSRLAAAARTAAWEKKERRRGNDGYLATGVTGQPGQKVHQQQHCYHHHHQQQQ
ncbi:uncharacterized protein H6S33_009150 [Morchella sextelata]|uniref:uncharacterized protein n=1 Tax=Morchella sextelata TaxID=1174677 RepID=UPI001D04C87E|nr:uncharacterized protein H6S33_009150 [Morchella sextelata]KAH0612770.1 hypothetical protein H6S33_009150 [Morchella sextelata]